MKDQDLKDAITDYFNDRERVCLNTIQDALLVVIKEMAHGAPLTDTTDSSRDYNDSVIESAAAIVESRLRGTGDAFTGPESAKTYLTLQYATRESEVFGVMFLDNRHQLIESREMFFGTIDGTAVHPREVIRAAIETNAAAVILFHNHPSMNPTPSEADKRITKHRDYPSPHDSRYPPSSP